MTKQRKPTGDYSVGYAEPPEATRFKKGQSGNPRGRTKGKPDLKSILEAMTQQQLTVSRNGRQQKITSLEAMLQTNFNKALKADPRAFAAFLALLAQYGVAMPKPEEGEAGPLDWDDDAIIEAFLRKQKPMDAAA